MQISIRSWVALLWLAFLWGSSFFYIKNGLSYFSPFFIVFLRIFIGMLSLGIVLGCKSSLFGLIKRFSKDGYFIKHCIIVGLFNNVVSFSLIAWAEQYISSAITSVLNAFTPIFTLILVYFFTDDEPINWHKVLGVVLGFLGILILSGAKTDFLDSELVLVIVTYGAVLLATLCYAIGGIQGKKLKRYSALEGALGMLTISVGLYIPIIIISWWGFDISPIKNVDLDARAVWSMLGLGVFSTGLAFITYFDLLYKVGVTFVKLVTFIIPIFAIFLGIVILQETLNSWEVVGVLVVFVSLVVVDGRLFFGRRMRGKK